MKVRSSWQATNVQSLVLLQKLISRTVSKKMLLAHFESMFHFHYSLKTFSGGDRNGTLALTLALA